MQSFKIIPLLLLFLISYTGVYSQAGKPTAKIKALIVDGQNNHEQWPKITYILKKEMEATGLFSVDVVRSAYTWKGAEFLSEFAIKDMPQTQVLDEPKPDPDFSPNFSQYDVVINNFGWNAAPWPERTQKNLEKYMKKGGGLVVFHAADNSFPKWDAYNVMIGLGGMGGNGKSDPRDSRRLPDNGPEKFSGV